MPSTTTAFGVEAATLIASKRAKEAKRERERERKGEERMGVKVYGMPMSTNTVRVLAALNEKGVEFELVIVDLRTGAHKKPDFLALNVRFPVLPSSSYSPSNRRNYL